MSVVSKVRQALARPQRYPLYDSTEVGLLPKGTGGTWAVAGYLGGRYVTYPDLLRLYPHRRKVSIAVFSSVRGRFLDVENGDATPEEAPGWLRHEAEPNPGIYVQVSNAQYLIDVCARAGFRVHHDF